MVYKLNNEENKKLIEIIINLKEKTNLLNINFYKNLLINENLTANLIYKLSKHLFKILKKNELKISEMLIIINILEKLYNEIKSDLFIFKNLCLDLINIFLEENKHILIIKILKLFNQNGVLNKMIDKILNSENLDYDKKRKYFKIKLKTIKEENLISFCWSYIKLNCYKIDIYIYLSKNLNLINNKNFEEYLLNYLLKNYKITYNEELFTYVFFIYKYIKYKSDIRDNLLNKIFIFVNNLSKLSIYRIQKYSLKCLNLINYEKIPINNINMILIPENFEDYKNEIDIDNMNCLIKIKGSIFYNIEDENPKIRIFSLKVLNQIYNKVNDIYLKKKIIKMLILNLNDDYDYVRIFLLNILINILNSFSIKQKFLNFIKNFIKDTNILIRLTIYSLLKKLKLSNKNFLEIINILKLNFNLYENERFFIYELLKILIDKQDNNITLFLKKLKENNLLYTDDKEITYDLIIKILHIKFSWSKNIFDLKIPDYYNKSYLMIQNLYEINYQFNQNLINSQLMVIYFNEILSKKNNYKININNYFYNTIFILIKNFVNSKIKIKELKLIKRVIYLEEIIFNKNENFCFIIGLFKKFYLNKLLLKLFYKLLIGKDKSYNILKLINILDIKIIPNEIKDNIIKILNNLELQKIFENHLKNQINNFKNQVIYLKEEDLLIYEKKIKWIDNKNVFEYNPKFPLNIKLFIYSNFEINDKVFLLYNINNLITKKIEAQKNSNFLIKKEENYYYEYKFEIDINVGYNIEVICDLQFIYESKNEIVQLFNNIKTKNIFIISDKYKFKLISNY